jgi:putative oxygen-independent coproporphyrinogen III oxidase
VRALADSFGVYVHVPYCRRICPYCDFNVHIAKRADWGGLAAGITAELGARAEVFTVAEIDSLYFGGGTPSLAPVEVLAAVKEAVTAVGPLAAGAEVTVEVDPATLEADGYAGLRSVGVTRVSLGWQSTHDPFLRVLGRGHSAADSEEAYRMARAAGFDDVSIDLIFGVPGETLEHLAHDLDAVERLGPDHVSLYALTYHEGTELFRRREDRRVVPVDDDLEAEMMAFIERRLVAAGYEHYEVSNYARPRKRSRHNQLYWHGGRYLGVGPGAHSFARNGWDEGWRWETVREPARYAAAWREPGTSPGRPAEGDPTVTFVETLTAQQLRHERFLLRLRTREGVNLGEPGLVAAAGDVDAAALDASRRGWLVRDGTRLVPTSAGLMNADALAALFFG